MDNEEEEPRRNSISDFTTVVFAKQLCNTVVKG